MQGGQKFLKQYWTIRWDKSFTSVIKIGLLFFLQPNSNFDASKLALSQMIFSNIIILYKMLVLYVNICIEI